MARAARTEIFGVLAQGQLIFKFYKSESANFAAKRPGKLALRRYGDLLPTQWAAHFNGENFLHRLLQPESRKKIRINLPR